MQKDLPLDLEECIHFHGHLCPGLTIGYLASKICMHQTKWKRAGDEELVCIAMNDGCAVDAVQYLTGCTLGKGNLILQDYGKIVFIFLSRGKNNLGNGIRISLKETPRWKKNKQSHAISKEEAALRMLKIPEGRLFKVKKLNKYPIPERARIFPSQTCASCKELTMEPRLRVQDGKFLCPECSPANYTRGW